MGVTRGTPALLRAYTTQTTSQVARSRSAVSTYSAAVQRLLGAASDLPVSVPDRSGAILSSLDRLDAFDQQPAQFASALVSADQSTLGLLAGIGVGGGIGLAPMMSPAQRTAWAADLVDDLTDAARDGRFSPELLDRLEEAANDPLLARALMDALGPDGLLSVPIAIDGTYRMLAQSMYHGSDYGPVDFLADGEIAMDALARSLALASDNGLPRSFADDLVRVATEEHGAAAALSMYLHRGGKFGEAFTLRVAEGLYDAERTDGSTPYWAPLAQAGDGTLPSYFGQTHWFDPLTGAFQALSHHPLAAQDFLLADDVASDGDRLSYLTSKRTWTADDGRGFGALVESATTVHRDHDGVGSPGYNSALIASRFLDELPYNEGGGWSLFRDTDPGFRVYDGLVGTVGTILSVYVADAQDARSRSSSVPGQVWTRGYDHLGDHAQAYGIVIDPSRMDHLLEVAAKDSDSMAMLLTAHHAILAEELDRAASGIHGSGGSYDERVRAAEQNLMVALEHSSVFGGQLLRAAELHDLSEARSSDATVTRLTGLANKGIGLALPGGPLTKAALGELTSGLTGSVVSSSYEARAQHDARLAVDLRYDATARQLDAVLLEHGWYDPEGPLAQWAPTDTSFLDDQGRLRPLDELTDEQRQAYDAWHRNAGTSGYRNQIATMLDHGIGRH